MSAFKSLTEKHCNIMVDPYSILGVSKKFTLQELRDKYKALAIQVHPDKGGTKELFLLVTKCYKALLQEHERRASQKEFHELKTAFTKTQSQPRAPSSNTDKFDLDKFNKVFSDNRLSNAYDNGYKEWMSDEPVKDIPKTKISMDKFNQEFEKSSRIDKTNKYIVKYREPEPLVASKKIGFTELGEEHVDDFSGENTTNKALNYMDYRVAHTTSKIVDPRLIKKLKTYKNVDELEKHRSGISYTMQEDTAEEVRAREHAEKAREMRRIQALRKQETEAEEQYERVNRLLLGRRS
jgi:curved DNA-binding protein CbpA